MNKHLIKLCLASILSLSLNTNLQAQELEQETTVTEEFSSKVESFIQTEQARHPEIEIRFSNEDMAISFFPSTGRFTQKSGQSIGEVLACLSKQEWLCQLKSFEVYDILVTNKDLLGVLSKTSNLEEFYIPSKIEKEELGTLLSTLVKMSNLHTLNFSHTYHSCALAVFARAMAHMPNLQALILYNTKVEGFIDDSVLTSFVKVLRQTEGFEKFPKLEELCFKDYGAKTITKDGWQALKELVSFTPNLTKLHLHLCSTDDGGLDATINILSNLPNLTVLDLSDNHLGPELISLAPVIAKMSNLDGLCLYDSDLDDFTIIEFVKTLRQTEGFAGFPKLRELGLSGNSIGLLEEEGRQAFAEFLSFAPNLRSIDFNANDLDDNLSAFAPIFAKMTALQYLDMANNGIEACSMVKFVNTISKEKDFKGFPDLIELNLYNNIFRDLPLRGSKAYENQAFRWHALMTFLSFTPNLKVLNLGENLIDDPLINVFIEVLLQTQSIAGVPNLSMSDLGDNDSMEGTPTRNLEIFFQDDESSPELQEAIAKFNPYIKVTFGDK